MPKKYVKLQGGIERSQFYKDMQERLDKDKDIKIIVVGRNAELGVGKTTFAMKLCKLFDDSWSADQGVYDITEYLKLYDELEPKSAILMDEMEKYIDRRRPMSKDNIDVSKTWSMMRYRQMITIGTLPSPMTLDQRLLELADARITVVSRGVALPYHIKIDDFTRKVKQIRYKNNGAKEVIRFGPADMDPDFMDLCRKKNRSTSEWRKKRIKEREENG